MNHENPTPIQVGMTGSFVGKRYRIDGRVVLSADYEGTRCFWNEFSLVTTDGETATLVHEEGDEGPEWRLFTLIEPVEPLSAGEADRVRVGNTVRLTGGAATVTLVGESRVEFIEGQAPDGVEVGDVAKYFNCETEVGSELIVASWTGDEIEFYRGMNLPAAAVAAGFRMPSLGRPTGPAGASNRSGSKSPMPSGPWSGANRGGGFAWLGTIARLLPMAFVGLMMLRACGPIGLPQRSYRVPRSSAPSAPLKVGSIATVEGRRLKVAGHAVVEVEQVHRVFERHEYVLRDESQDPATSLLLVCGLEPQSKDWYLCSPASAVGAPSAVEAGALRLGQRVMVESDPAEVTALFRCTTRQADLQPPDLPFGAIAYGFAAVSGDHLTLGRWDSTAIRYHRGTRVAAGSVTSAFASQTTR